ncbi:hypothetical protein KP509_17G028700 [Ceratopteris richardii]|uniref:Protein SCAR n=1 Tax=Ceratopteris richardii TaxID=49495 RepID=A0A8T2SUL4_CERRI|nr:hypothetical protein KP509_17G028700 [Ceratopteris richardii]KAH7372913.1 hypothetical protein KP509_17G028700 [Ceratopteris richardii]KAH7372914.1 hypothetical protein KP509_17G028700 [Ceratopteris richardii]
MPLTRYEIRSEYSLANPDLYRVADKDDPEGLLEGVAMAGLVGIIRQLGDLAEFAAEIFYDLHEDLLATASRGHEIAMRVRQLEKEVPLIEKKMIMNADPLIFMYDSGMKWHVHIHDEQNHFTQGDLPRFIRGGYEICRSPPRFFALDRFDVIGDGACLKRFTDPSFFKMQWARSELMRAEKEQQDHEARRLKRKGQRQENGGAGNLGHSYAKFRAMEAKDEVRSSTSSSFSESSGVYEQEALYLLNHGNLLGFKDFPLNHTYLKDSGFKEIPLDLSHLKMNGNMVRGSSSEFLGQERLDVNGAASEPNEERELHAGPPSLAQDTSIMGKKDNALSMHNALESRPKEFEITADDSASEAETFVDAVATMDSEIETDTEVKERDEVDADNPVEKSCNDDIPLESISQGSGPAEAEQIIQEASKLTFNRTVVVDDSDVVMLELNRIEKAVSADNTSTGSQHKEAVSADSISTGSQHEECVLFANDDGVPVTLQGVDIVIPSIPVPVSSESAEKIIGGQPAYSAAIPSRSGDAFSSSSFEEDTERILMEQCIDNSLEASAEEKKFLSHDISKNVHSSEDSDVCSTVKESGISKSILDDMASMSSDEHNPLETLGNISMNIESTCVNKTDEVLGDTETVHFNRPNESALGSGSPSPKIPDAVSSRKRWQLNKPYVKTILIPDLEVESSDASGNEKGESPVKLSSESSPNSSIHPIRWAQGDDAPHFSENDGIVSSLGSLSSNSSAFSSPRPSGLTTILQSLNLECKSGSILFQKPVEHPDLSPRPPSPPSVPPPLSSPDSSTPSESKVTAAGVSLVEACVESVRSPASEHSVQSNFHSSASPLQQFYDSLPPPGLNPTALFPGSMMEEQVNESHERNNLKNFPPPPPLPPLAWRMTKRSHSDSIHSGSLHLDSLNCSDVGLPVDEHPQVFVPSKSTSGICGNNDVRQTEKDSAETFTHMPSVFDSKVLQENDQDVPKAVQTSEETNVSDFVLNADSFQEKSATVVKSLNIESNKKFNENSNDDSEEKLLDGHSKTSITQVLHNESVLSRPHMRGFNGVKHAPAHELPLKPTPGFMMSLRRDDSSEDASSSSAVYRLKRRSKWALTPSTASPDDREVLLEQIRTKSFNLRNSPAKKLAVPRQLNNINVAAILKKANSIRQAFAGSDEDDGWSDT